MSLLDHTRSQLKKGISKLGNEEAHSIKLLYLLMFHKYLWFFNYWTRLCI
uniref:Uncharacterized protein n=1 Tax=Rhizophora mucronata TaxID=61149 RepID=A0A2P2QDP1_RHIMU